MSEKVNGELRSCAELMLGMDTSISAMSDKIMRVSFTSQTRQ